MNSRYGTEWLELFGAALCGISAGVFWMAEAAIAIAYPEPWNKGKALGYWLTYRLSGQILGGAVNIGLNVNENKAGKVSYTVYILFIAIQAAGPLVALLLNKPSKVQRKDGQKVSLEILQNPWFEIKKTTKLFFTKKFLLIVPLIGQAVFSEAVFFTYLSCEYRLVHESPASGPEVLHGEITDLRAPDSVVQCACQSSGLISWRRRRRYWWQCSRCK